MIHLLIAIIALVVVATTLIALLIVLRAIRIKRRRAAAASSILPASDTASITSSTFTIDSLDKPLKSPSTNNHRGLTISTAAANANSAPASKAFVMRPQQHQQHEKSGLLSSPTLSTPPTSPLPEIRITFPDEVDGRGRPQSGRVVVVRMGENSAVGLEPLDEAKAEEWDEKRGKKVQGRRRKQDVGGFEELDLERMGGLKEKRFS